MTRATGWPPGPLMQDDCRGLAKWFASKPDARRRVREAIADIRQKRNQMITATQISSTVDAAIKQAAEKGDREVFISIDSIECRQQISPTAEQQKTLLMIQSAGYLASIDFHGGKYVPRGLQDDNGDGPEHRNYGYHIKW